MTAVTNRIGAATLAALCAGVLPLTGCGDDGAASGDQSYAAYNLFTGAPRFAIFKADGERELCVRVVFLWSAGEGTLALDDALTEVSASVTDRASDCSPGEGGAPPSLEAQGIPAESLAGTVTVERTTTGGADRWTVSIDGTIGFAADEAWVPATETVEAEALEIVGGCC